MAELDRSFFKTFTQMIVGLMLVSYSVMFISTQLSGLARPTGNPQPLEPLETRIAPVSQNYVGAQGEEDAAAVSAEIDQSNAALSAAAPVAEAIASASDETAVAAAAEPEEVIDGGQIYNSVCFACHMAGVAGAPKLEAAAWTDRIARGRDLLVQNAIAGFQGDAGVMPPKGGRLDLSDAHIQATVEWMLDNLE